MSKAIPKCSKMSWPVYAPVLSCIMGIVCTSYRTRSHVSCHGVPNSIYCPSCPLCGTGQYGIQHSMSCCVPYHVVPSHCVVHEDRMNSGSCQLGAWYIVGHIYHACTFSMRWSQKPGRCGIMYSKVLWYAKGIPNSHGWLLAMLDNPHTVYFTL